MDIVFEWDPRKSRSNLRKHGVTFEEATSAFFDPLSLTIPDPEELQNELRWQLLGMTKQGKLVVVAHTESGATVRIISVRLATRRERKAYEEE